MDCGQPSEREIPTVNLHHHLRIVDKAQARNDSDSGPVEDAFSDRAALTGDECLNQGGNFVNVTGTQNGPFYSRVPLLAGIAHKGGKLSHGQQFRIEEIPYAENAPPFRWR